MKSLMKSILTMTGIVFLRFRPLPRVWCLWLAGVNLAGLAFLQHLEAVLLLAATSLAVLLQAAIHRRMGFVRLLGVAHVFWVPVLLWMATRGGEIAADPGLQLWIVLVAVTNLMCVAVDTGDVVRFLRGDRAPHYRWA